MFYFVEEPSLSGLFMNHLFAYTLAAAVFLETFLSHLVYVLAPNHKQQHFFILFFHFSGLKLSFTFLVQSRLDEDLTENQLKHFA